MSKTRIVRAVDPKLSKVQMYDLLRQPLITEKASMMMVHNQVAFLVPVTANKFEVKAAVEGLFDVKVEKVNTLRQKGKTKGFRGIKGTRPERKKAIVTLAEGHSIDVASGL